MAGPELEQLAVRLERPIQSLAAFNCLTPDQLRFLSDAIDDARRQQREAMEAGLDGSLRGRLRRLALWLLGWRR